LAIPAAFEIFFRFLPLNLGQTPFRGPGSFQQFLKNLPRKLQIILLEGKLSQQPVSGASPENISLPALAQQIVQGGIIPQDLGAGQGEVHQGAMKGGDPKAFQGPVQGVPVVFEGESLFRQPAILFDLLPGDQALLPLAISFSFLFPFLFPFSPPVRFAHLHSTDA
jgi:hypothetical protein